MQAGASQPTNPSPEDLCTGVCWALRANPAQPSPQPSVNLQNRAGRRETPLPVLCYSIGSNYNL